MRKLQTMTEATQRVSSEAKARQPAIPWQQIAAFRNVLVHNYLGIDIDLIWTAIQNDVARLKQAAQVLLDAEQP